MFLECSMYNYEAQDLLMKLNCIYSVRLYTKRFLIGLIQWSLKCPLPWQKHYYLIQNHTYWRKLNSDSSVFKKQCNIWSNNRGSRSRVANDIILLTTGVKPEDVMERWTVFLTPPCKIHHCVLTFKG